MRTLDIDLAAGTVTVGAPSTFYTGAVLHWGGQPHLCKMRLGANAGRVVAAYIEGVDDGSGNYDIHLYTKYSDNDCSTWSAATQIGHFVSGGIEECVFLAGNGTMVEIPSGTHAGRLVFAGYGYGPATPWRGQVHLWYSDDQGANWSKSNILTADDWSLPSGQWVNECALAFARDGSLLMEFRSDSVGSPYYGAGAALWATSTNGGTTIAAKTGAVLALANCCASMLQTAPTIADGIPKMLLAAPAKNSINRSTYSPFAVDTPFGYSSMQALDDQTVLVAYETPVGGVSNNQESIRLLVVNLKEIMTNGTGFV
jgi:hypothetical protein